MEQDFSHFQYNFGHWQVAKTFYQKSGWFSFSILPTNILYFTIQFTRLCIVRLSLLVVFTRLTASSPSAVDITVSVPNMPNSFQNNFPTSTAPPLKRHFFYESLELSQK